MKGDIRIKNIPQHFRIIIWTVCSLTARRQIHHRDHDLVMKSCCGNPFTGITQITEIVKRVKIADGGDTMLLEHLRMQVNHVPRLLIKRYHIDAASQSL